MANKDTSKQWFETGDYPTQAQFYQVFDWLRWKDEGITIADVAALQGILDSIQNTLNSVLPNQLISGGNVSIDTDDGTTLSVYLPETHYKLKAAPYIQAAGTFNLALRPAAGLFRIDVFYLDSTGFHVVTGATSVTPVKPGAPDGSLELSNILIGFDNVLDVSSVPDTPDLSAVLAAGNEALSDIIISQNKAVEFINDYKGRLAPEVLSADRDYKLPDRSGTLAIESDFDSNLPANLIIRINVPTPGGILANKQTFANALSSDTQAPVVGMFKLLNTGITAATLYITVRGLFKLPDNCFENNQEIVEFIDLTGELKEVGASAFMNSSLNTFTSNTVETTNDLSFAISANASGKYDLTLIAPRLMNSGVYGSLMGVLGYIDSGTIITWDYIYGLTLLGTAKHYEVEQDVSRYVTLSSAQTISGQKTFTDGVYLNNPVRTIPILSANVGTGDAAVFETGSAAGITVQSRSSNAAILNVKSISGTNGANAVTRWWVDSYLTLQLYCGGTASYWYPETAAFDAPTGSILFLSRLKEIFFSKDPNNYKTVFAIKMNKDGAIVIGKYTKAQRDAFTNMETGMLLWQTDNTPGLYYYDGAAWRMIMQGSGFSAAGIPYADASGNLISDANFKYDGNSLQVGNAGLFGSNRINFNGGRGYIESSSGGFVMAVSGGSPADSSKSISFKNVTREWLLLYLPAGDAATTPLEGKASMNFSPASNKSHLLGKSETRWNKLYAGNVNLEVQTAPASSTATGEAGEVRITSDYIYVCVATNTWKRTALETF